MEGSVVMFTAACAAACQAGAVVFKKANAHSRVHLQQPLTTHVCAVVSLTQAGWSVLLPAGLVLVCWRLVSAWVWQRSGSWPLSAQWSCRCTGGPRWLCCQQVHQLASSLAVLCHRWSLDATWCTA
jgi:hypothetical protein